MWDLIVSVPDHCLSFYFGYQMKMFAFSLTVQLDLVWVLAYIFRDSGLMENGLIHGEPQVIQMTLLSWNCSPY